MYDLPYFKETDPAVVNTFITDHPFAFLSGCDAGNQPVVTQLPLFLDQRGNTIYLSGHIMRNTDHHLAFVHNPNVLAVFTGAHSYVSASWYSNPRQASTWNYMSVHAKGILKFLDQDGLLAILKRTTNYFENDPHSPSNFEQLPEEYVGRLSRAIIGIEIEVNRMENVFKLSQNRDEASYQHIIEKLSTGEGDGKTVAAEMKKRASRVFSQPDSSKENFPRP